MKEIVIQEVVRERVQVLRILIVVRKRIQGLRIPVAVRQVVVRAQTVAAAPVGTAIPAVVPAALTVEVREAAIPMAEAPEETAVTAAEVTWIWSGHRICCSPARAIAIYILRML